MNENYKCLNKRTNLLIKNKKKWGGGGDESLNIHVLGFVDQTVFCPRTGTLYYIGSRLLFAL